MATLTIPLTDEEARQLNEIAKRLDVPMEQLAKKRLLGLLSPREERFQEAAREVIEENAELYRRLA